MCTCGHAHARHEFYTQTLHGCKDCASCTYYRPTRG